ncbi:MAG TPA: hypothetical protein VKD67_06145 [Acidimicrobiales bacterium]|nr:hypothetical protein [Acidimicrobiales bacterium]
MSSDELRRSDVTGWVGWIVFAAFLMIINGIFGGLQGLTALLRDQSYWVVSEDRILTFNYTSWGWIHLILGIVLIVVGIFLLRGATWARVLAVILVAVHMIAQFSFLAAFPVWGIITIAVDALVLYALLVHGREISAV